MKHEARPLTSAEMEQLKRETAAIKAQNRAIMRAMSAGDHAKAQSILRQNWRDFIKAGDTA